MWLGDVASASSVVISVSSLYLVRYMQKKMKRNILGLEMRHVSSPPIRDFVVVVDCRVVAACVAG